jgi:6-phosphogluconolactonase (cycloisomerase 2 family)
LAIDATGSFLAVVDSGDNTLRVFAIDPDTGELAESDDSPISTGDEPRSIAIVNVD